MGVFVFRECRHGKRANGSSIIVVHCGKAAERKRLWENKPLCISPTRRCTAAIRKAGTHCLHTVWCFDGSVVHHRQAPPLSAQSVSPSPIIHTCSACAIKPTWSSPAHQHAVDQLQASVCQRWVITEPLVGSLQGSSAKSEAKRSS